MIDCINDGSTGLGRILIVVIKIIVGPNKRPVRRFQLIMREHVIIKIRNICGASPNSNIKIMPILARLVIKAGQRLGRYAPP